MSLRYAYNTNGMLSHRLEDALSLLADTGYDGVALTLDHVHLDPLRAGPSQVAGVARLLRRHRLACAIETGARFALDAERKHWPPLCHPDPLERMRRIDFLHRSLDVAAELGAEVLNLATGRLEPGLDATDAGRFLVDGLQQVMAKAKELEVAVALEPEPGHQVQTLAEYRALEEQVPDLLLTIDVSHVSVAEPEGTAAEAVRAHAHRLALVHLEDAPLGVHEHLPLGEGELDVPAIIAALQEVGFGGLCAIELSRHSHAAHELTRRSLEYLRQAE